MVLDFFIDKLSDKNTDDIHMTLNASSALQELCENENLFQALLEEDKIARIVDVCSQLDSNIMNNAYALNFLNTLLK